MYTLLTLVSLLSGAAAYLEGWDPNYCCYPPPDECCSTPPPCPQCADLAFIVDISSSIGNVRLQTIINPYLKLFATTSHWAIGTGPNQYQGACVTYSTTASLQWDWMSPQTANAAALEQAFGGLTTNQFAGFTNTGDGLLVTRTEVLEGPGNREGCDDICILITDGQVNQEPGKFAAEAPLYKNGQACDLTIVIGISTAVSEAELLEVASATGNLVLIPQDMESLTYQDLADTFESVAQMICPALAGALPEETDACCPYEYPYYFQLTGKYY